VKLQKILIFLSIVNLVSFIQFSLVTWVFGFSMQVILGSAFYGAYKRRIGLLRFYVVINIILMIIAAIAIGLSLTRSHNDVSDYSGNNGYKTVPTPVNVSPLTLTIPKPQPLNAPNSAILSLNPPLQPIQQSPSIGLLPLSYPQPMVLDAPQVDCDSATSDNGSPFFLVSIGLLVLCLVIFALKLATVLMCAKMARMLMTQRATNLAHPVVKPPTQMSGVTPPMIHAPHQHPQVMYVPINMAQSMNSNMYGPYMQSIYPMYNPYLQPQFQAQYPQVQFGNQKQQV